MPITIAGSGTITGISAGGLPDDSIIAADIAAGAVTTAKVADANITAAKLDGAQSGSAPIYAARAWVNFNGTGTVAIRASGNVSSITDRAVGKYTINFSTSMPDANYAVVSSAATPGLYAGMSYGDNTSTSSGAGIETVNANDAFFDASLVFTAIFR